jgi:hypothetical protein
MSVAQKHAESTSVPVFIRLPVGIVERLDDLSERTGLSRNHVVRVILSRAREQDVFPTAMLESAEELRPVMQLAAQR